MPNTSTITNNLNILHIEDDVDYREDWDMVLSEHFPGCVITGKRSAEAAIKLVENSYSPDIIILDIRLSGTMDGVDFLHWLRNDHEASSLSSITPVIILSGFDNQFDQVRIHQIDDRVSVLSNSINGPDMPDYVVSLIKGLTSHVVNYPICGENFKDYLQRRSIVLRRNNLGLTPSEYGILQQLLRSHPTPTSSANLAINLGIAPGSIPVHISAINNKIVDVYENRNQPAQIRNSSGYGYYIGGSNQ